MSPHLPAVAAEDLIRVAKRLGFELRRQKGSHAIYLRAADKRRVVIPVHAGKMIKPKTLAAIVRDMGMTIEEFRDLL